MVLEDRLETSFFWSDLNKKNTILFRDIIISSNMSEPVLNPIFLITGSHKETVDIFSLKCKDVVVAFSLKQLKKCYTGIREPDERNVAAHDVYFIRTHSARYLIVILDQNTAGKCVYRDMILKRFSIIKNFIMINKLENTCSESLL